MCVCDSNPMFAKRDSSSSYRSLVNPAKTKTVFAPTSPPVRLPADDEDPVHSL